MSRRALIGTAVATAVPPFAPPLGLAAAQRLVLTESFYWDLNDRTRAFTRRVLPKTGGNRPAMSHAGCYAGVLHYLKAVADMGVAQAKRSGAATVARMKAMPTDDDAFGPGTIREDGRKLHSAYLFEVNAPRKAGGLGTITSSLPPRPPRRRSGR